MDRFVAVEYVLPHEYEHVSQTARKQAIRVALIEIVMYLTLMIFFFMKGMVWFTKYCEMFLMPRWHVKDSGIALVFSITLLLMIGLQTLLAPLFVRWQRRILQSGT